MTNPYIIQMARQEGMSYEEAARSVPRPQLTEVPARLRDRYATVEEYREAIHDFLNGQ